jgi:hypothetical protein
LDFIGIFYSSKYYRYDLEVRGVQFTKFLDSMVELFNLGSFILLEKGLLLE